MVGRDIWRLRLKYEHSVQRCALCGHRGVVGEDMKLHLADEREPAQVVFRCADRAACWARAGEREPPDQ